MSCIAVRVCFVCWAGDLYQAKENFGLALSLNANYEKAKSWQRKVRRYHNTTHAGGR